MEEQPKSWDYLIVTASNELQAASYRRQLALRRGRGLLKGIREVKVVPDPEGRRAGSGGSTVYCLLCVLKWRLGGSGACGVPAWVNELSKLRVLIIHAGGESKRLPAYGACGKIFVPVPGKRNKGVQPTVFDRQLKTFLELAPLDPGTGQVVVAAGDALIQFDPSQVRFRKNGITALGSRETPEQASRHGVFCPGRRGNVRLYLQKPDLEEQRRMGAVGESGLSVLDLAVMGFDGSTAVKLLETFGVYCDSAGFPVWGKRMKGAVLEKEVDLYREICCALGTEATCEHYMEAAKKSGSRWDERNLAELYSSLKGLPLFLQVVPDCAFLHFGTTRQLITSSIELVRRDTVFPPSGHRFVVNSEIPAGCEIHGRNFWVEGCRFAASVTLSGDNILVGVDVQKPLELPEGACLDILKGQSHRGKPVWFIRCYGISDQFKDKVGEGALFCNMPVGRWIDLVGAGAADVWDKRGLQGNPAVWDARLFPAEEAHGAYRRWLWMYEPAEASGDQRRMWLEAERYSLADMAVLSDQDAFHRRRQELGPRS